MSKAFDAKSNEGRSFSIINDYAYDFILKMTGFMVNSCKMAWLTCRLQVYFHNFRLFSSLTTVKMTMQTYEYLK